MRNERKITKTAIVAKQEEDSATAAEKDEEDRQDNANNASHLLGL